MFGTDNLYIDLFKLLSSSGLLKVTYPIRVNPPPKKKTASNNVGYKENLTRFEQSYNQEVESQGVPNRIIMLFKHCDFIW